MGKALTNLGRQVPQPGILYVRQGLVGGEDSEACGQGGRGQPPAPL